MITAEPMKASDVTAHEVSMETSNLHPGVLGGGKEMGR